MDHPAICVPALSTRGLVFRAGLLCNAAGTILDIAVPRLAVIKETEDFVVLDSPRVRISATIGMLRYKHGSTHNRTGTHSLFHPRRIAGIIDTLCCILHAFFECAARFFFEFDGSFKENLEHDRPVTRIPFSPAAAFLVR